jgi:hypothetical protein
VRLAVYLADSAQADDKGKVSALGLGWRNCGSPTPGFAVVILLEVDWDETNVRHQLVCELLTDDGQPVTIGTPVGQQLIRMEAIAEAGRPPGTVHGDPARVPIVFAFPPGLPLQPGRYQWRASVTGFDRATEAEFFTILPSGPPQPGVGLPQPPGGLG